MAARLLCLPLRLPPTNPINPQLDISNYSAIVSPYQPRGCNKWIAKSHQLILCLNDDCCVWNVDAYRSFSYDSKEVAKGKAMGLIFNYMKRKRIVQFDQWNWTCLVACITVSWLFRCDCLWLFLYECVTSFNSALSQFRTYVSFFFCNPLAQHNDINWKRGSAPLALITTIAILLTWLNFNPSMDK